MARDKDRALEVKTWNIDECKKFRFRRDGFPLPDVLLNLRKLTRDQIGALFHKRALQQGDF